MTDAMGAGAVDELRAECNRQIAAINKGRGVNTPGFLAINALLKACDKVFAATPSPQRADASEIERLQDDLDTCADLLVGILAADPGRKVAAAYAAAREWWQEYDKRDRSATSAGSPEVEEPALSEALKVALEEHVKVGLIDARTRREIISDVQIAFARAAAKETK